MPALPWRLAPDCTHDCASAATGWIVINLVPRFRNAPALCAIREYPQPSAAFALMEGRPLTFPQDHRILADFTPDEILRNHRFSPRSCAAVPALYEACAGFVRVTSVASGSPTR